MKSIESRSRSVYTFWNKKCHIWKKRGSPHLTRQQNCSWPFPISVETSQERRVVEAVLLKHWALWLVGSALGREIFNLKLAYSKSRTRIRCGRHTHTAGKFRQERCIQVVVILRNDLWFAFSLFYFLPLWLWKIESLKRRVGFCMFGCNQPSEQQQNEPKWLEQKQTRIWQELLPLLTVRLECVVQSGRKVPNLPAVIQSALNSFQFQFRWFTKTRGVLQSSELSQEEEVQIAETASEVEVSEAAPEEEHSIESETETQTESSVEVTLSEWWRHNIGIKLSSLHLRLIHSIPVHPISSKILMD